MNMEYETSKETPADAEKSAVESKKKWLSSHIHEISTSLNLALPNLVKNRTLDLPFELISHNQCGGQKTSYDLVYAISYTDLEDMSVYIMCCEISSNKLKLITSIRTNKAKLIYEKMMKFIESSNLRLYDFYKKTGFFHSFLIRVTNSGDVLLEVTVHVTDTQTLNRTKEELKYYFCNNNPEEPDVNSLIVTTFPKKESEAVSGSNCCLEFLDEMIFLTYTDQFSIWNPFGMKNLGETIVNLTKSNDNSTGVLQVDFVSVIPTLVIAQACKKMTLTNLTEDIKDYVRKCANLNNIDNITSFTCLWNELEHCILENCFDTCKDICAVVFDFSPRSAEDVNRLRNYQGFSKIVLCVPSFKKETHIKGLFEFCKKRDLNDHFIITKATTVEMSPFGNEIWTVFLLERQSKVKIVSNEKYLHSAADELELSQCFAEPSELINESCDYFTRLVNELHRDPQACCIADDCAGSSNITERLSKVRGAIKENEKKKMIERIKWVLKLKAMKRKEAEDSIYTKYKNITQNNQVLKWRHRNINGEENASDLQKCISDMICSGGPITFGDYEIQMKWKQAATLHFIRTVSNMVTPGLFYILKTCTQGYAFEVENLTPCKTVCSKSDRLSGIFNREDISTFLQKIESESEDCKLPFIQFNEIRSDITRRIYEKILDIVIETSMPLFNVISNQGFWKDFEIVVNTLGEAQVKILTNVSSFTDEAANIASCEEILACKFTPDDCIRLKVKSLVYCVCSSTEYVEKVLFGDRYLVEAVEDFQIFLHDALFWTNVTGIKQFSEKILELAGVDITWRVLQIGSRYVIPTLYLSKVCNKVYLYDPQDYVENGSKSIEHFMNIIRDNMITNVHIADSDSIMSTIDKSEEDFCVLVYEFIEGDFPCKSLRSNPRYKKIIFSIANFERFPFDYILDLCEEKPSCEEPFVIVKVVSVDLSPTDDSVLVLFLLVRKSLLPGLVCENISYSKTELHQLVGLDDKLKHKLFYETVLSPNNASISSIKYNCEKMKISGTLAQDISHQLMPILPKIVKDRSENLAFHLKNLVVCPSTETLSDMLTVHSDFDPVTGQVEMKFSTSPCGDSVLITNIDSYIIKRVYEDMIIPFLQLSSYPLFNPNTRKGFWISFIIRVNDVGEVLLIIEGYEEDMKKAEDLLKVVSPELQDHFLSLNNECLKSLVFSIYHSKGNVSGTLTEQDFIEDMIDSFTLKVYGRPVFWYNPFAVSVLSRTIAEVAGVGKTWTVVQLGAGCDAIPFYLTKICSAVYMLCPSRQVKDRTIDNASKNKISNFSCRYFVGEGLKRFLSKKFRRTDKVCVLYFDLFPVTAPVASILVENPKYKKIIFLQGADTRSQTNILRFFCCASNNPYIITNAVPVDLSCNRNEIKMIYLLERESKVCHNLEVNTLFSKHRLAELQAQEKSHKRGNLEKKNKEKRKRKDKIENREKENGSKDRKRKIRTEGENNERKSKNRRMEERDKNGGKEHRCVKRRNSNDSVGDKYVKVNSNERKSVKHDSINAAKKENSSTRAVVDRNSESATVSNAGSMSLENSDLLSSENSACHILQTWCKGLEVENYFYKQVTKVVQETRVKTWDEYEDQLRLKQMWALSQAKCLSDILKLIVPFITVNRSPEIVFLMDDLRASPLETSASGKFEIVWTFDPSIRDYTMMFCKNSCCSSNCTVDLKSDIVKDSSDHITEFIKSYDWQQFHHRINPGFWEKVTIQLNAMREVGMVIHGRAKDLNLCKRISAVLFCQYSEYLKKAPKRFELVSLVLRTQFGKSDFYESVIFGESFFYDKVGDFKVRILNEGLYFWPPPIGNEELTHAILELLVMDRNCCVLQIGRGDGITSLYLANACKRLVIIEEDSKATDILAVSKENFLFNISLVPPNGNDIQFILGDESYGKQVYVLVYNYKFLSENDMLQFRTCSRVKKILLISESRNLHTLKKMFTLCKENPESEHSFVITKSLSVDLSPYENKLKLLYLFENMSLIQGKIESNLNFNRNEVIEFEKIKELPYMRGIVNVTSLEKIDEMLIISTMTEGRKPFYRPNVIRKTKPLENIKTASNSGKAQAVIKGVQRQKPKNDNNDGRGVTASGQNVGVQNQNQDNQGLNVAGSTVDDLTTITNSLISGTQVRNDDINVLAKNLIRIGLLLAEKGTGQSLSQPQNTGIAERKNNETSRAEASHHRERIPHVSLQLLSRKSKFVFSEAKTLSNALQAAFPSMSTSPQGLVFSLENFRPCHTKKNLCEKFQVFSGVDPDTNRVKMVFDSHVGGKNILQSCQHSETVMYIYNKFLDFCYGSQYNLYHPGRQNGFWKSITVLVNHAGESLLLVEGYNGYKKEMHSEITIFELSEQLKWCFQKKHWSKKYVTSLIFKITSNTESEEESSYQYKLIGEDYLTYDVCGIRMKVHDDALYWPDPFRTEVISNTILELGGLDKQWTVLQLRCESIVISLILAKTCDAMFIIDDSKECADRLIADAKENSVSSLDFFLGDINENFKVVISKHLSSHQNVCVLLCGIDIIKNQVCKRIRQDVKIKKIICVVERLDTSGIDKLLRLCKKDSDTPEPFTVIKAIPVDTSPYEHNVKMLYLLVRASGQQDCTSAKISDKISGAHEDIINSSECSKSVKNYDEMFGILPFDSGIHSHHNRPLVGESADKKKSYRKQPLSESKSTTKERSSQSKSHSTSSSKSSKESSRRSSKNGHDNELNSINNDRKTKYVECVSEPKSITKDQQYERSVQSKPNLHSSIKSVEQRYHEIDKCRTDNKVKYVDFNAEKVDTSRKTKSFESSKFVSKTKSYHKQPLPESRSTSKERSPPSKSYSASSSKSSKESSRRSSKNGHDNEFNSINNDRKTKCVSEPKSITKDRQYERSVQTKPNIDSSFKSIKESCHKVDNPVDFNTETVDNDRKMKSCYKQSLSTEASKCANNSKKEKHPSRSPSTNKSRKENTFELKDCESSKIVNLEGDKTLLDKIDDAIYSGGVKSKEVIKQCVMWKQQWVLSQMQCLSHRLKHALPNTEFNNGEGFVFDQDNLKPCPLKNLCWNKFEVFSAVDPKTGFLLLTTHIRSDGSPIRLKYFYSDILKQFYIRIKQFISKSGYELFHPTEKSGLWQRIIICMNEDGHVMVTVIGQLTEKHEEMSFSKEISRLSLELKECFEDLESCCKTLSLIWRTQYGDILTIPVIGDGFLSFKVGSLNVRVHASATPWSNVSGIESLTLSILEVGNFNKTWGVVQLGCGYVYITYYLAKLSKQVLVMDKLDEQGEAIVSMVQENGIHNVEYISDGAIKSEWNSIFENHLDFCKNVCVFINESHNDDVNASLLRGFIEIKQIVWVVKFTNEVLFQKLCTLCEEKENSVEPFIITKAIPVDMSPYENNIKIVYLLVRKSFILGYKKRNSDCFQNRRECSKPLYGSSNFEAID